MSASLSSLQRPVITGALLLFAVCAWAKGPEEPAPGIGDGGAAADVVARRHLIVAAHPLAAEAGLAILRRGGTALDAAIAAEMVLNVVEPQSSGIGGGGFLLYFDRGRGQVQAYDGRETAPAAAGPDLFLDQSGRPLPFMDAVASGRSVGVPGLLRMLDLAHREHGRLPWPDLFEPAIRLAESGFPVSPRLHGELETEERLRGDPAARVLYFTPEGSAPAVGTIIRNPELAASLRLVAQAGADALYRGPLAPTIVAAVRAHPTRPGSLDLGDLAGYRAIRRDAVCGPYRIWIVCGMPPPSSGGIALLQILALLERFPVSDDEPLSAPFVHLFAEAGRLAFADRDRYLADPDFVSVPVAALLDPVYLAQRSALVDTERDMGKAASGMFGRPRGEAQPVPEPPSTSHISVVDDEGNAVALTSSIESAFGARIQAAGFLLNNELTDFSFLPEENGRPVANRVEGGKRPRSSMAPTLVFDRERRLVAVLGSPGGSAIIPYVAKALVAMLDWRLGPQAAAALPNIANRNGATELEAGTAAAALAPALESMGHKVTVTEMRSGLGLIRVEPDHLLGGADPRRDGVALGD